MTGPLQSKKFWAFLFTLGALLATLVLATWLKTDPELAASVVNGIVISGLGIVFGQGGVDAVKAYSSFKNNKETP